MIRLKLTILAKKETSQRKKTRKEPMTKQTVTKIIREQKPTTKKLHTEWAIFRSEFIQFSVELFWKFFSDDVE